MKIIEFNPEKGIYNFELNEIDTHFHAHPAIEILHSINGTFSLETKQLKYANVSFGVIDKNVIHKISSNDNSSIRLLMVECNSFSFQKLLAQCGIELEHGVFVEQGTSGQSNLLNLVLAYYTQNVVTRTNDKRVEVCLNYLEDKDSDYKKMIDELKTKVNLSESRLSHVFKEEVGISLKKYLVWSRLKRAFQLILKNKINLYEGSIQSGFYDQAHLSKAFKQMLGLSPSEVYNSRTIQDK